MTARRLLTCAAALSLVLAGRAAADEILFLNGDRLSGKIVGAAGGKLTIKTEGAGDVSVDLSKVKTFSTLEPVTLKVGETLLISKVTGGPDGTVQVVPVEGGEPHTIPLTAVTQINPPPAKWTGSITASGQLTTGNSETENAGGSLNAVRRAEKDRITVGGSYYYGRQKDRHTGEKNTTVNNWLASGKYDYFLTKQLYLFGALRFEGDQIADLDLRFTPSAGVGYQWYETPTFTLSTEAGLAWVYEDFRNQDSENHFAARLAYHVDWKPHETLFLFHNVAWLPSVEGPYRDYNLNLDAGLRATIVAGFFAEAKIDFQYDSKPASGAEKADVRYLLGLGWSF